MTRTQRPGLSGEDPSVRQAEGSRNYDVIRNAIADGLVSLETHDRISLPRLVGDLFAQIEAARTAGQDFSTIAKLFEQHGVPATPDAMRVALGRERKRRNGDQPTLKHGKMRRASSPAPPATSSVEIPDITRQDTSPIDPEPIRDTQAAPPRVGIGRHLD